MSQILLRMVAGRPASCHMDQALLCRVGTRAERRWDLLEQVTTAVRDRIRDLTHVTSARVSITEHLPWTDVPRLTLTR